MTLAHDVIRLEAGDFHAYGKIIALSLLHGCPGPHNFCKSLANFILGRDIDVSLDEVPVYEVFDKLSKVKACKNQAELDAVIADFGERYKAGYNTEGVRFQDVDKFVRIVAYHFVIERQLGEMEALMQGLGSNGVLSLPGAWP